MLCNSEISTDTNIFISTLLYYHCVPMAWCVHKARQVIPEYRDNIVLVYFVDVIVLS